MPDGHVGIVQFFENKAGDPDRPTTTNQLGGDITFMDEGTGQGLGLGADDEADSSDEDEFDSEVSVALPRFMTLADTNRKDVYQLCL